MGVGSILDPLSCSSKNVLMREYAERDNMSLHAEISAAANFDEGDTAVLES